MSFILRGVLWLGLYLGLVCTPLFVLLLTRDVPGRGFWWDFSVSLGFSAAAMLGVMFVLTCRLRRASLPFGMDVLYYFHRAVAWVILAALACHATIPFLAQPEEAGLLASWPWPTHLRAAAASAVLITVLLGSSFGRSRLRLEYDVWRLWHALLAPAALILAWIHMAGVGYYLSTPVKRVLWTAIGACLVALVLYMRGIKPWRMGQRPYRVESVERERGASWTVTLRPEGHPGLSFVPGQFAWLTLDASPFAMREHPFSIASSAAETRRLQFTIKELGDFTRTIGRVETGAVAYLDGPYGVFSCDRHDNLGYVFIAGGIGIAPVASMLRTLADRQDKRPLLLLYANRSWDEVTLREELAELSGRLNLQLVHVLEDPPPAWDGARGRVSRELLARYLPDYRSGREYFLCGPLPMNCAVEAALLAERVPLEQIHTELFNLA